MKLQTIEIAQQFF